MDKNNYKNVYFVGVGGIGMAALARYYLSKGWKVAGYDRTRTDLTDELAAEGVEVRTRVCAAEFVCEQLGRDMADKEFKYLTRKVSKLIADMPNWERLSTTKHVERWYGVQRGFRRIDTVNDDEDI